MSGCLAPARASPPAERAESAQTTGFRIAFLSLHCVSHAAMPVGFYKQYAFRRVRVALIGRRLSAVTSRWRGVAVVVACAGAVFRPHVTPSLRATHATTADRWDFLLPHRN